VSGIKAGLVQMSLKAKTSDPIQVIRDAMLDAHEEVVKRAAAADVKVLGFQEVFNQPYFPPSRDRHWYDSAERIPDGPSIQRCKEWAKKHSMVIVAPIYEEEAPGVYYNAAAVIDANGDYLGKYRKTHIPDLATWPEKFFFKPGNLGFPVFQTAYLRLGVYICYDRHFPEGFRALALAGADLVITPSATGPHSRDIWELEIRAAAVANGMFIGAINRVGEEAPWNVARFFGNSFFSDPRGNVVAQGSDGDDLIVAEIDLGAIREVRHDWQFFRDRRPDVYGPLVDPAAM